MLDGIVDWIKCRKLEWYKDTLVMEEEELLIVGNGFDLGIGFKTSYNDFMASEDFPNADDSRLAQYLNSVRDKNLGWVDIEHELSKMATATIH